jgi:tetratricopeptide (TPR) repeat protein/transglutaminase-like putative cysteine protease
MKRMHWARLAALAFNVSLPFAAVAQEAAPSEVRPPTDHSGEPFVVEEYSMRVAFENDGTSVREEMTRIRIQSDAALQQYGVLTFGYQGSFESVEVDYIRIRKPDGSVVATPGENAQDMPAAITREAPFYSDLREKHISVKGVSIGDTLESHVIWRVTKALVPGQFWVSFNTSLDYIALRYEVRISIPRDRAVKWSSADTQPVISIEGRHRVFTWLTAQLTPKLSKEGGAQAGEKGDKGGAAAAEKPRAERTGPDVWLSSFQSWEAVGEWFRSLMKDRVQPSPEIRAKAAELTKGLTTEDAKIRVLYNYVSTQVRYIGVAFGVGRYQPHPAAEVLANQYGDCKDKHTLLAALLAASGVNAFPALIDSKGKIEETVPSPGQFDHVITAVPKAGGYIWLDTTPEIAPFGYLIGPLRDKRALVIPADAPPTLVATYTDPPTPALQTFRGVATLGTDGTLEGTLDWSFQGDDTTLLLRSAFRKTPMPSWKDLVQLLARRMGFAGEVSDARVESVSEMEEPLRWTYKYTRKDFPDWANRRVAGLMPYVNLPRSDEKSTDPVKLGSPAELHYTSSIKLPAGSTPQLPPPRDLKEAFADYAATYAFEDGSLKIDRRVTVRRGEVSVGELDAYRRFAKVVEEDDLHLIDLDNRHRASIWNYEDAIWDLPYSKNHEAGQAYDDARAAYQKRDFGAEIAALEKAVRIDPTFTRAWLWLGNVYGSQHNDESMFAAYKSAFKNNPKETLSLKVLAFNQMRRMNLDDAVATWRKLIALAPEDADGYEGLGLTLLAAKRDREATEPLESALRMDPSRSELRLQLGMAYLNDGQKTKAVETLRQSLGSDPQPAALNNVAYVMEEADVDLPLALEFAERSVRADETGLSKVTLANLEMADVVRTWTLGNSWDTLGSVHAKMGHLDRAQRYLEASWALAQTKVVGEHLAKVYERQHKPTEAARMSRLAAQAERGSYDPTDKTKVRPNWPAPAGSDTASKEELVGLRTVKLEPITSETASAEFFLLIGPDSKVIDAKFISGDEALKKANAALKAARFDAHFPDDQPTRLVRRGVVMCSSVSGCSVVLYAPAHVNSLE